MHFFRLVLENAAEKKHIKNLNTTIECLETKCEELQSSIDDIHLQMDLLKRRSQTNGSEPEKKTSRTEKVILSHTENKEEKSTGLVRHQSNEVRS